MKDAASPSFGNIDRLLEEIGNKYLLVNVARVRAQQLVNGIEPLVEGANPEKAVTTAFSEIRTGKLDIDMENAPPANDRRG
ncbi:MAG TPA: DNA-directed RNA polymerase subunit omega [Candidatus Eremiobacteraceae bacterium]|nr:DNA-directed RNA polymerase subunit omega [Candidatus Eremiobacteraceae bacterium]